jgi:hypothetical protein
MNGTPSFSGLWRNFQSYVADVRQSRFFHDRLSGTLLTGAFLVNGLNFVWLLLHLKPTEAQMPTHYSNLVVGFEGLGPWFFPFEIALFALVISILNAVFAYYSFRRNRLASFFLLTGSGVVAIFSLIISTAFEVVR